jgi:hypothetical protein
MLERLERMSLERQLSSRNSPRFEIAQDATLAAVVKDQGVPRFAQEDGVFVELQRSAHASAYLADAIAADAVIVPAGHHVLIEGDDDDHGSWLRVSLGRDDRRPQLSWGWIEMDNLPAPADDADPLDAVRVLLTWLVDSLNGLLAHV